jgi:NAD(P)-dependent dehydrogenase (short-subunit alcohol dehydrogenase family)
VIDFSKNTAVITGAGSGIGKALAERLIREGMRVAVLDIDAANAQSTAASLGDAALAIACDVSDTKSVQEAVAQVLVALGAPTIVCANAGVTAFEPFADMSEMDIDWIYHVNLLGVSRVIRATLPAMLAAGRGGHIIATSSMAGLVPTWAPIHVPYTATKGGILGLMMNLRSELANHNIGCTTICPGGVSTNIFHTLKHRPERFGGPSNELLAPPAGFTLPSSTARRSTMRTPEQVAEMVVDAIRTNEPLVVTDGSMRGLFEDYAKIVLEAFDRATAFQATRQLDR